MPFGGRIKAHVNLQPTWRPHDSSDLQIKSLLISRPAFKYGFFYKVSVLFGFLKVYLLAGCCWYAKEVFALLQMHVHGKI